MKRFGFKKLLGPALYVLLFLFQVRQTEAVSPPQWKALFDGTTLQGWVLPQGDDAKNFSLRDGVIHIEGTSGWMHTEKVYSNFTLRAQVRFVSPDGTGNTGIFLRSPENSIFGHNWPGKSFEFETRDMRVNHGPAPPAFGQVLRLGGNKGGPPEGRAIFDAAAAQRAYDRNLEWNDVELVANQDRIWTYINGELISTVWGVTQPSGHVGLQSEAGASEWRAISIREHSPVRQGFQSLFNGRDTTGWILQGPRSTENPVKDGAIVVIEGGPAVRTSDRFGEFHLKFNFRVVNQGDIASVAIRASDSSDPTGAPIEAAEIQLRALDPAHEPTSVVNDPRWPAAILRRGKSVGQGSFDTAAALGAAKPAGEWQEADIQVTGEIVTVRLNGTLVSEADRLPNGRGGSIVLLPNKGRVEFKNIAIEDPMGEANLEAAEGQK